MIKLASIYRGDREKDYNYIIGEMMAAQADKMLIGKKSPYTSFLFSYP
jgi:hypothetical protein